MYYLNVKPNHLTIVDKEDYEKYKDQNWYYKSGYASNNKEYLHRLISKPKEDEVVDHINHDKLDNRRFNLRNVSVQENSFNRKLNKNNKNKIKGLIEKNGRFIIQIKFDKKQYYVGTFETKLEAESVSNCLNFIIKYFAFNKNAKTIHRTSFDY